MGFIGNLISSISRLFKLWFGRKEKKPVIHKGRKKFYTANLNNSIAYRYSCRTTSQRKRRAKMRRARG